MSGSRLRSGKILAPEGSNRQQNYSEKKAVNISESNMASAKVLEELKSTRLDLKEVDNLRRSNDDLKKRLEHLERYSREFSIRVLGVNEDEGEDCISKILDFITSLGFEDVAAEVENAHRTGKKRDDKPRPIIAKLYSRPFKRRLLQAAKSADGKEILQGVRIVEDFTPSDFDARKKALPTMRKAYEDGKKVRFTKGKLYIDGREVPVA